MSWRSGTDQMGRKWALPSAPKRIVSLVPSQTELLADLGLDTEVIGITKFCVHPEHWLKEKAIVGGTKNPDLAAISGLRPDLIIGNKEENREEDIHALCAEFTVWMSDVGNLPDALEMIHQVGYLTDRESKADSLISEIETSFQRLQLNRKENALYLIWYKPWMGVGSGTFIHDMMARSGYVNVLAADQRYPQLSDEDLQLLNPDVVLLPSEPFPFSDKHVAALQSALPKAKIFRVDGEMFSWYGSRLKLAPAYFEFLASGRET